MTVSPCHQRDICVRVSWFNLRFRICAFAISILLFFLFFTPLHGNAAELFTPNIEQYTDGWIDWDKGIIYARGSARLRDNNNSKGKALGAARLVASANVVKIAAGINLDERRTIKSLGETFTLKLKAFLHYRPHSEQVYIHAPVPYAEVVVKTPIHGVRGLTAQMLKYLHGQPLQWHKFPLPASPSGASATDQETWLVVDARDLPTAQTPEPSLFPKLLSSTGATLYDLNKVEQASLHSRGMARYVHSNASPDRIRQTTFTPHRNEDYAKEEQSLLDLLNPVTTAIAAQRQRRPRYIISQAQRTKGLNKTNLVISAEDAKRLRAEDSANKILRQCRVIVVSAAPIGGIEGHLHKPSSVHMAMIVQ